MHTVWILHQQRCSQQDSNSGFHPRQLSCNFDQILILQASAFIIRNLLFIITGYVLLGSVWGKHLSQWAGGDQCVSLLVCLCPGTVRRVKWLGWLQVWLHDWLAGYLICWLVDLLAGWLVGASSARYSGGLFISITSSGCCKVVCPWRQAEGKVMNLMFQCIHMLEPWPWLALATLPVWPLQENRWIDT